MFVNIPAQLGYGALFGLVLAESAGLPLPGETALIAAGLLAGSGQLALPVVVAVGAVAAILGDNLGYWIGRRGGRALLLRGSGRFARHRHRSVARAERFFERYGPKAVFFGRWISGVRVVAAVVAGTSAMPWRSFLLYNALGAVAWSASVAGVAALLGPLAAAVLYGAGIVAAGGAALFAAARSRRARRLGEALQPA